MGNVHRMWSAWETRLCLFLLSFELLAPNRFCKHHNCSCDWNPLITIKTLPPPLKTVIAACIKFNYSNKPITRGIGLKGGKPWLKLKFNYSRWINEVHNPNLLITRHSNQAWDKALNIFVMEERFLLFKRLKSLTHSVRRIFFA